MKLVRTIPGDLAWAPLWVFYCQPCGHADTRQYQPAGLELAQRIVDARHDVTSRSASLAVTSRRRETARAGLLEIFSETG
jgi:hypothetical protein